MYVESHVGECGAVLGTSILASLISIGFHDTLIILGRLVVPACVGMQVYRIVSDQVYQGVTEVSSDIERLGCFFHYVDAFARLESIS